MQNMYQLHPKLIDKIQQLVKLCESNGIRIAIGECLRTTAEQDALYAKGRTAAGSIVTNCKGSTYSSMHQWGVAFDFYLQMDIDGDGNIKDDTFNNSTGVFDRVGRLGQSIGLEWGGAWKSIVDRPHFQLPDWGSTATKLKSLYGTPEKFFKTWESAPKAESTVDSSDGYGVAVVTASSGLVLRDAPNTLGKKLTTIPFGKECKVFVYKTAIASGLSWSRVQYNGTTGYVADKYLQLTVTPSEVKSTTPTINETYSKSSDVDSAANFDGSISGSYTTTAKLNMRAGAGKDKDIVMVLPKGAKVNCYGYYNKDSVATKWFYCQYGKYTGYCHSAYLKK